MRVEDLADTGPRFVLEEYFLGRVKAWGMFQDRFGTIRRRFTVDIEGNWDGKLLILTEVFTYADGPSERRVWSIRRTGEHGYEGTADGVVGSSVGRAYGCALHWRYDFDLLVGTRIWRVRFDDWMFLQDAEVMINRARVTKWGLELGQALLLFRREGGPAPQSPR